MRKLGLLVAVAVLLLAAIAWARPADRDPAFSGDGIAELEGFTQTRFLDVARLPGGDIVAVGRASGGTIAPLPSSIAARYDANGNLRSSLRLPGGSDDSAVGIAIDSQGRMLVALDRPNGIFVITRLVGENLAVDETYGRSGFSANGSVDSDSANFIGLGVTPDDRPVVVASRPADRATILRWNTDGVLDPTFGTAGRIVLPQFNLAHDMLVDAAGRVVIARSVGGQGFDVLRITDAAPGTVLEVPDEVESLRMQVALSGANILVSGLVDAGPRYEIRVAQLSDAGVLDPAFGTRTAQLPDGVVDAMLRDTKVDSDRRILTAMNIEGLLAAAPLRIALVRLNADGTPDTTFNAGDGDYFAADDLGASARDADPLAGVLTLPDGRFVLGGRTGVPDGDGSGDRAFVARYGVAGLPPDADISRSYNPIGDPPSVRGYARPGQAVELSAGGSTDPDGTVVSYAWDPEGDGIFGEDRPVNIFRATYPAPGTYEAAVRVRDSDGLTETDSATVVVRLNERPALTVRRGYDADPAGSPSTFAADRPVNFKATATDADGNVKRIQLDLDGQPGFEVNGATGTRTFNDPGTAIVNVRATDDEGGFTDEQITLTITEPPCGGVKEVVIGRLKALAQGWKREVTKEGQPDETVTWTACEPPPPQFLAINQVMAAAPADQFDLPSLADRPSVNGIYFVDPSVLQIIEKQGAAPRVVWAASRVDAPAPGGTRFSLINAAQSTGSWKLENNTLKNVAPRDAIFGGLKVGQLGSGGTVPLPALGQARFSIYPALPPVFGGVTAATPFEWTTNAPQRRQLPGGDCFRVNGASLPGLDFLPGGQGVNVCRRADDPDAFDFNVRIDLAAFDLPAFDGLPKLDASGGIDNGELTGLAAEATLPGPGVSIIGPVFLRSIDFQLVLDESSLVDLGCVRGVGVKVVSFQEFRDLSIQIAIDGGVTGAQLEEFRRVLNEAFPDYEIDYGRPSSALCGGAGFYAGFDPVELASGNISLGIAEYDDGRPDAFRIIGDADILEIARGDAEFSVYSSGYADMRARVNAEFFDLVSLEGRLLVQVHAPTGRYNAEAGVTGCVIPVDACAGIRALISNRGLGACLLLSFLGADWEPGATYSYRDGLTAYFSGCDLGDVRVTFNSGESSTIITPLVPDRRAAWSRTLAPAQISQREKHQQTITVKPGMPGVYIAVRGQGDQLAKFTLMGPNGERISADGPSDPTTATEGNKLLVGNDEKLGITHVMIGKPAPGKWTLTPDTGSVPIVEVVGADGIDGPEVRAKVTGSGHQRVLSYDIKPRKGQVVRFREDGPTGNQFVGEAKGRRGKLRFDTAVGNAEQRTIVAIVAQDGLPREELEVARFKAPATQKAGRIARAIVRRKRSKVTVRWLPSSGALSYEVRARLTDGRVIVRETEGRKLVLTRVAKQTTGAFTVAGIDAVGEPGKATRAKLKPAGKQRPAKKKKKRQ